MVHVEEYTPNVIEPSFGIDRILTAIYEHTYSVRAKEGDAPEEPPPKKGDTKDSAADVKPGVLAFPPEVANPNLSPSPNPNPNRARLPPELAPYKCKSPQISPDLPLSPPISLP